MKTNQTQAKPRNVLLLLIDFTVRFAEDTTARLASALGKRPMLLRKYVVAPREKGLRIKRRVFHRMAEQEDATTIVFT